MSELDIPENWAMTTLDVFPLNPRGQAHSKKDVPECCQVLVEMEDMESGTGRISSKRPIPSSFSTKNVFEVNDILYGKLRPYLNKCGVATVSGICSSEIFVVEPNGCDPHFVSAYFRSPAFVSYASSKVHGARMPRLSRSHFADAALPLPPFGEQRRIFEKIYSTFEKVEQIENATNEAEQLVKKYRESLLAKAFRGELVPQTSEDEPAPKLLERIRKERAKQQNGKKKLDIPPIADEEVPFEIPQSWEWVRLQELGTFVGGMTPSTQNSSYWDGEIPWVSPKDMKRLYLSDSIDHISVKATKETRLTLLPPNSLLFVVRGMILIHSFPVAMTEAPLTINQDIKALVPSQHIVSEYVLWAMIAAKKSVLETVKSSSHGTMRLEAGTVENWPIPLAPHNEQMRIVAALKESEKRSKQISSMIDEVKKKTRTASNSILSSAFSGRLVKQEPSEGTGKDLLTKISAQNPAPEKVLSKGSRKK